MIVMTVVMIFMMVMVTVMIVVVMMISVDEMLYSSFHVVQETVMMVVLFKMVIMSVMMITVVITMVMFVMVMFVIMFAMVAVEEVIHFSDHAMELVLHGMSVSVRLHDYHIPRSLATAGVRHCFRVARLWLFIYHYHILVVLVILVAMVVLVVRVLAITRLSYKLYAMV